MKTFTKRILLLASILLIWNITAKHVNPLFVPEPVTVFDDLIGMIHTGQLIKAIEYSFLRITAATFISGAIAFPIAILVYNSRIAKDILNPIISVMRYIPVTAFYPLLIMWFGIDEMMKIVFFVYRNIRIYDAVSCIMPGGSKQRSNRYRTYNWNEQITNDMENPDSGIIARSIK